MEVAVEGVVFERVYTRLKSEMEQTGRESIARKYPMAVVKEVHWGDLCRKTHNDEDPNALASPHHHCWITAETDA